MATTRPADETTDEAGVHRLRDILVEEVSLVDRAANKRRFLIVKRKNNMANGATEDDDETEKERRRKARKPKPEADDEAEDAEKARRVSRRGEGDEDGDVDDAEKARRGRQEPADTEEEDDDGASGGAKKPGRSHKARGARAEEDGEDDEDEDAEKRSRAAATGSQGKQKPGVCKDDRGELLKTLTAGLDRLVKLATTVKDATGAVGGDVAAEANAIAEMLTSIGATPTEAVPVGKAGARMAKDRLERFNKAIELLSSILKELTESRASAAEPTPTAGTAQANVAKGASTPSVDVAQVLAGLGQLTEVVKRQGEQIARLRQAPGTSNAVPVEGGRRSAPAEVAWPLDMNRPIQRDKVSKDLSFFDEE